jgi:succinate dehydrogenase flavin-adding protein (antitoxin of CptAB toxin-antitoxin module)
MATTTQNNIKRITLSISQIAPLIGIDNYNNFPKIFCEIWRRYNPEEFREYELKLKEEGNNNLANSSEMNDIWEIDMQFGTNLIQQVKTLNENKEKSSSEMVKIQDDITKYINKQNTLTDIQKNELTKKICSITNKNHGVNNEDTILKEFCYLTEKTLQKEQGWVEIPLINNNLGNWIVIGKYDGITTENELVEAKMRQKALFKKMRDYENVQVQLYLHALTYKQAYLVECISNNKTNKSGKANIKTDSKTDSKTENNMQLYIHEIQYDPEYVNEFILDRLKKFVNFFENIITNEQKKIELLKGDNKREIYKYYEEEFLGIIYNDF